MTSIPKVRDFFGIKYVIPYSLSTNKPIVVLRVIGELSYENPVDAVPLLGGHSEAPWDVEYGQPDPTLSGTFREYPSEVFKLYETYTITDNAAESDGSAGSPTNHEGTSVFNGSNGISAVSANASTKSALQLGQYVFVATAAQEVDIYINGLANTFLDIEGMVYDGLDCSSAGTIDIDDLGIQVVVTGTAAFDVGDSMSVEIRPENTGSTEVLVGAGTEPTNFGLRCIFPKKTDGVMHFIDVFNVSARGMGWKGTSREWSEYDGTMKPVARASDGAVYQMTRVLGV